MDRRTQDISHRRLSKILRDFIALTEIRGTHCLMKIMCPTRLFLEELSPMHFLNTSKNRTWKDLLRTSLIDCRLPRCAITSALRHMVTVMPLDMVPAD